MMVVPTRDQLFALYFRKWGLTGKTHNIISQPAWHSNYIRSCQAGGMVELVRNLPCKLMTSDLSDPYEKLGVTVHSSQL